MADQKNENKKNPNEQEEILDPGEQYRVRLEKLNTLIEENGFNPYEHSFHREHTIDELLATEESKYEQITFIVAGRLRARRIMGKAAFMEIEDETGRIQIYGSSKDLGDDYNIFKTLDLGDILGVTGKLFITKTGQTTLHLSEFRLLSKCLRPLPVVKEAEGKVFDAFHDKELRYRQRYVDLIVNHEVRETFMTRSKIIQEVRNYLTTKGFLEVETPMMQPIPGGAVARPFKTHHNALNMSLYLRIAPELYLKRLIVGGFSKVFELNRNFRNEGISYKHNPEFTMLELYEAYSDMKGMMDLCEDLIVHLTKMTHDGKTIVSYDEHEIDLTPPWERITYRDVIKKYSGVDLHEDMSADDAKKAAIAAGIKEEELKDCGTVWKVSEVIFDEMVEPKLIQPVFITHFPLELSPLAKVWLENKNYVERFEPYVAGREIGNAFSELNDPIDQKLRFEEQVKEREAGNEEGGYMDHDYIRALEYGLPPTGGLGIGIDRIVMLLTNTHTIRDTILFPLMRSEDSQV